MGGVFFCKNVDLSSTQGALCTVSVLFVLHFTYLGVRTLPTHPLPCLRACEIMSPLLINTPPTAE